MIPERYRQAVAEDRREDYVQHGWWVDIRQQTELRLRRVGFRVRSMSHVHTDRGIVAQFWGEVIEEDLTKFLDHYFPRQFPWLRQREAYGKACCRFDIVSHYTQAEPAERKITTTTSYYGFSSYYGGLDTFEASLYTVWDKELKAEVEVFRQAFLRAMEDEMDVMSIELQNEYDLRTSDAYILERLDPTWDNIRDNYMEDTGHETRDQVETYD